MKSNKQQIDGTILKLFSKYCFRKHDGNLRKRIHNKPGKSDETETKYK